MSVIKFETIESKLIKYNEQWVLLDKDVANLYEIEPKKLRQQIKRNSDKFPSDYVCQLTENDLDIMVSQNVTPSKQYFGGSLPYVFTEKGLYMVATILKSKKATEATFTIIETFSKVKELSRNINGIMKTEDQEKQKELAQQSNQILEDIIEIEPDILTDDEEGEIVKTTTKFEFNLGFAKVSRSIKKIKK
ncbi:MAG: ORF6N domain-containing protein [Epsilonproteobacteria bacterium]|nr:ORF6N domain-containing protein [Campylobacterota bacterium]